MVLMAQTDKERMELKAKEKAIEYLKDRYPYSIDEYIYLDIRKAIDIALKVRDEEWESKIKKIYGDLVEDNIRLNKKLKAYKERVEKVINDFGLEPELREELKQKLEKVE